MRISDWSSDVCSSDLIARQADGVSIAFVVTDGVATVPVRFRGVVPDLFKEDSGVVAEGQFQPDGSFVADNLLAKHDEKYMPPQVAGAMHETTSLEPRSEEHTSELQSLMRISYAVFCLKTKNKTN